MVITRNMTSALRSKLLVAVSLITLSGCVSAVTEDSDTASLSPAVNSAETGKAGDTNSTANNGASNINQGALSENGTYVDPAMTSAGRSQHDQQPELAQNSPDENSGTDIAGLVHQSTSISAGNTSIYSNNNAGTQNVVGVGQEGEVPINNVPAYVPVPAINPSMSSVYSAPAVSASQNVAPEVQQQTSQAHVTNQNAHAVTNSSADVPVVATQSDEVPSGKSGMTLAAFFAGAAKKRTGKSGNGEQAVEQAGVQVAQLPTDTADDITQMGIALQGRATMGDEFDDEHLEEEDAPVGLMKLASLSGLTRIAPNGLVLQTDKVNVGCFKPELVKMIKAVENHYKRPAIITSGYRPPKGVRQGSKHYSCEAADIQIKGVSKWELANYLRSLPNRGGVGTYCHTESVHMDLGEARDWNWRCRRTASKKS